MIKKTVKTEKIPIKMWLDDIEPGALKQIKNVANLPFAFSHVAVMPDAHEGYGMPIGGVLAAVNNIIPNAVGVDIGCGMCATKTSLKELSKTELKEILKLIRIKIPLGFKHHKKPQNVGLMPDGYDVDNMKVLRQEYNSALRQLGTLGGGNHFIEIQKGDDGFIWIMVHSGSRNLGKKVADHYNKLAKELNRKMNSPVDPKFDLAFIPMDTDSAVNYFSEMNYCVDFALANRKLMLERVSESLAEVTKGNVSFGSVINIAHNYASAERHFGCEVIVHRKGATSAKTGEVGIIPGSQGSKSYIVEGLGNPESFMSCSHGAGRKMGRKQAQRELDFNKEVKKLNDLGILHGIKNHKDLDEAAGAYKDIDEVMKNQADLVSVKCRLMPIAVVKG